MPQNSKDPAKGLVKHFKQIRDPRVVGRCKHDLYEILVIAVCALIGGAQSWVEMEEFGVQRKEWLSKYLKLPGGIPSHDTFARVFSIIEPSQFEKIFTAWVKDTLLDKIPKRLCMDGKSVAGTQGRFNAKGERALHLVSLYAQDLSLVLAQAQANGSGVGEGGSAIECLEMMSGQIKGALISGDAGLATRVIAQTIIDQKADYILPIKGNQRLTLNELKPWFAIESAYPSASTEEKAHGRTEKRVCQVKDPEASELFKDKWPEAKSVIRIIRTRGEKDKRFMVQKTGDDGKQFYEHNIANDWRVSEEEFYFISSRKLSSAEALTAVREHWSIENNLHWHLDVAFSEDQWRGREKVAARNLAVVRKFAMNLFTRLKDKGSLRVKLKRAAWNMEYLEKVVFGEPT